MNKRASDTAAVEAGDTTEHSTAVDVDPTLARQLALAGDDTVVEAVLVLRQRGAQQRRADIAPLLQRLGHNELGGAIQHTLLPRLGVLIVRASAGIIRRLIADPAIVAASANSHAEAGVLAGCSALCGGRDMKEETRMDQHTHDENNEQIYQDASASAQQRRQQVDEVEWRIVALQGNRTVDPKCLVAARAEQAVRAKLAAQAERNRAAAQARVRDSASEMER